MEKAEGAATKVGLDRGGVEIIAKFGELGASGVGWDDGYRSGVDRNYKGGGQQGVVYGG